MSEQHVEHEISIAAPVGEVYDRLADVTGWPALFPPTIHAEQLERDGAGELIRLWATANGRPKTWTSRRTLDPDRHRITFRQEVSAPPVASMGGEWILTEQPDGHTAVLLTHDFAAVDDSPDGVDWINRAVDRNSRAELAALKDGIERRAADPGLLLTFADSVEISGTAAAAFAFVNEAQRWSDRLPHVVRADLTEEPPGVQVLDMDTRAPDGSVHTTSSVRVTFPPDRIVYKQLRLPALLALHLGRWTFTGTDGHVVATSEHTVAIQPDAVPRVLGPEATIADALAFVRRALSTNSLTTLAHAKSYAEDAVVATGGDHR